MTPHLSYCLKCSPFCLLLSAENFPVTVIMYIQADTTLRVLVKILTFFHSTCWLQSAYFQMQKNTEPDKIQMSMHQTDVNIHNKTLKEIAGTPVRMLKLCKLLFRTFRQ
jgi:hypothetical protein